MSKLTDERIQTIFKDLLGYFMAPTMDDKRFARAIEAAATEPLLQRIAELEKALKLVQQHHATAWNRGHIAGMAANRMVAQDALNAVKKDAWNNTQLTEALMAAEGRCEELERQLEEVRKQALEEAAKVCDDIAADLCAWKDRDGAEIAISARDAIRAMQKAQPTVQRLPADDTEGGAV